jgi:hypothetical protein
MTIIGDQAQAMADVKDLTTLRKLKLRKRDLKEDYKERRRELENAGFSMQKELEWPTGEKETVQIDEAWLISMMKKHPHNLAKEVIQWNRNAAAWRSQIEALKDFSDGTFEAIGEAATDSILNESAANLTSEVALIQQVEQLKEHINELTVAAAQHETEIAAAVKATEQAMEENHSEEVAQMVTLQADFDKLLTDNDLLEGRYNRALRTIDAGGSVAGREAPDSSSRSIALPEVPKFGKDKDVKWDNWYGEIRRKMKAEKRFKDEAIASSYIMSRVEGDALDHLSILHLNLDKEQDDVTAAEMLTYLEEIYDDPLKDVTARRAFKSFRMPNFGEWHSFKSEFIQKATRARISRADWKFEIFERMYPRLREGTALQGNSPAFSFDDLCNTAAVVNPTYTQGNINKDRKDKDKEKDKKPTDDKNKTNNSGNSRSRSDRTPPAYKAYGIGFQEAEELRRLGKCYKCKEHGHLASECTVKLAPIELSAEPPKDSGNA